MPNDQEFDQKAATFYSVAQILAEGQFSERTEIDLELFFKPTGSADQPAFLKALKTFGYTAEVDTQNTEDDARDVVFITVATKLTAEEIWLHENRTAKLAATRGYTADGWGFPEPDIKG